MRMTTVVGLGAVVLLAFANGANDNAKPVATLVGAGLARPRRALFWGTLATLAGSLLAIVLGKALIATFSAKGLVDAALVGHGGFLAAVAAGAAVTVLGGTRLGLPISTTHALIGAIVGAGLAGGAVDGGRLVAVFLLPLLTSPALAFVAAALLYPLARAARRALGVEADTCVCVGERWTPVGDTAAAAQLAVAAEPAAECRQRYVGRVVGFEAAQLTGTAHWLSALALSAGRGLQDGAKIAGIGILLAGAAFSLPVAAGVAVAMATGGLLAARRVSETMSTRIARMNHGQGLVANVVATTLVFGATLVGVPVSTTHVTTGALAGLRAHGDAPGESWIGRILVAWLLTLPLGALLAFATFRLAA